MTDGGLETELIFHDGIDLPCFAAFPLLENPDTRARLRRYYDGYLDDRARARRGLHHRNPNVARQSRLGRSARLLARAARRANRAAVSLAEEVRAAAAADGITAVVSGCVGPRGDGYDPGSAMTPEEAERYHAVQIGTFATTTADQVTAITMTNAEEAIGIVRAASAAGIPSAISFTVETDGRLPDGPAAARGDRTGGRGDRRRRRLLHGQLRAPDAFLGCTGSRWGVAATARRPARERIREEPRRARRGDRTRRGRSGRPRRPARRAA